MRYGQAKWFGQWTFIQQTTILLTDLLLFEILVVRSLLMTSSSGNRTTIFPLTLVFFFTFQDVAGNSLGLLPPSFPAAIVDSGKCRYKNRFSKLFAGTLVNGLKPFESSIEQTTETMPRSSETITASMMTNIIISLRELLQYRNREYLRLKSYTRQHAKRFYACKRIPT